MKAMLQLLETATLLPELARKELPAGVATAWHGRKWVVKFSYRSHVATWRTRSTITGQLGEVMQESARAAQSYLWSHAADFGIDPEISQEYGVHLHVPAEQFPKMSECRVTITSALASLYTEEESGRHRDDR